MRTDSFVLRHVGPRTSEVELMLQKVGVNSLDQLINQTIPDDIRLPKPLDLPPTLDESEFATHIKSLAAKNKQFKTYIGLGYHATLTPAVIQRNIFENPSWYTSYTPYQAEISQGRLEALLNYQTMVGDLTGFELVNSSLLDEGSAASEAMIMLFNNRSRAHKKANSNLFFVSNQVLPQTIDILKTRATPLGIKLVIGNYESFEFTSTVFGACLLYTSPSPRD